MPLRHCRHTPLRMSCFAYERRLRHTLSVDYENMIGEHMARRQRYAAAAAALRAFFFFDAIRLIFAVAAPCHLTPLRPLFSRYARRHAYGATAAAA